MTLPNWLKLKKPDFVDDYTASGMTVCCELFNQDLEDVIFVNEILRMNVKAASFIQLRDLNLGPQIVELKGQSWAYIPHQFYVGYKKSGKPIRVVKNYGRSMFKKNALPSAPENWTKKLY